VLISDKGFHGLVIKNNCKKIEVRNNQIITDSGAILSNIVGKATRLGLSGLEFAIGIPGTIGGAVVNNAGIPFESISKILVRALIMNEEGKTQEVDASYFRFRYRYSRFKKNNNKDILIKIELQLRWEETDIIRQKIKNLLKDRQGKQPYGQASAGSIFKNPSSKQSAGFLIEKANLKKKGIGEAFVSPKHANFIIAKRGAKASDIANLIKLIKDNVKNKYDIALEEEIQYIGEWD